mmetsp:Transcript_18571/g.58716  ORF Transcript_18571/g.58716 Transcript_18571/m.58716 type:complete len:266 (+) Transcript_18571:196-993(+)
MAVPAEGSSECCCDSPARGREAVELPPPTSPGEPSGPWGQSAPSPELLWRAARASTPSARLRRRVATTALSALCCSACCAPRRRARCSRRRRSTAACISADLAAEPARAHASMEARTARMTSPAAILASELADAATRPATARPSRAAAHARKAWSRRVATSCVSTPPWRAPAAAESSRAPAAEMAPSECAPASAFSRAMRRCDSSRASSISRPMRCTAAAADAVCATCRSTVSVSSDSVPHSASRLRRTASEAASPALSSALWSA